jgi:hypothetical protein
MQSFKYFGIKTVTNKSVEEKLQKNEKCRNVLPISEGHGAYSGNGKNLRRKNVLIKSCCMIILMYRVETWKWA